MAHTKRNRKQRRRLRMTLKSGHEVRHKLRSGRTGKVHSVKMRSPKKSVPTGKIELLIPPVTFPTPEQIINQAPDPLMETPIIRRRRKPLAIIEEPFTEAPIIPEIITSVDKGTQAYGYVLRAIECLSINSDMAGKRDGVLLRALLQAIDQYERK